MLNNTTVAHYLREKANRYLQMANELDADASPSIERKAVNSSDLISYANKRDISFEDLMRELNNKGGRLKHIAARIGSSEEWIKNLLSSPNSKYYIGPRGWIKLKPGHDLLS